MAQVNTIHGLMDDSQLLKSWDGVWSDNEDERSESIEYCLKDCQGNAHSSGQRDAPGHFCHFHVHRSAHVTLKKTPTIESSIGSFA